MCTCCNQSRGHCLELIGLLPHASVQSIMSNWDRLVGTSPLLSSHLSHIISSNNFTNSFMSFSTSCSNTDLWGIYLVSEGFMNVDANMAHFMLNEWTCMLTAPIDIEVICAKSQLKAGLLLSLNRTTAVALKTLASNSSPLGII